MLQKEQATTLNETLKHVIKVRLSLYLKEIAAFAPESAIKALEAFDPEAMTETFAVVFYNHRLSDLSADVEEKKLIAQYINHLISEAIVEQRKKLFKQELIVRQDRTLSCIYPRGIFNRPTHCIDAARFEDYAPKFVEQNPAVFVTETVQALQSFGLCGITEEYLIANLGFSDYSEFHLYHKRILMYLVTGTDPHPTSYSSEEITNLDISQRLTIKQALDEIVQLNFMQLGTLKKCYSSGLRGEHLRNWHAESGSHDFSWEYQLALETMILEYSVLPEEAVKRITGINTSDATDFLEDIGCKYVA